MGSSPSIWPTPRLKAGSRPARSVTHPRQDSPMLRQQPWVRYHVKDGEKGPILWEVKRVMLSPVDENGLPGDPLHLSVCRNPHDGKIKYFVAHAPPETPVEIILPVAFSRWKVERCFEDGKQEVGLDHDEGRTWQGLLRHRILSSVRYLFLAKVHQEQREGKPERTVSQVPAAICPQWTSWWHNKSVPNEVIQTIVEKLNYDQHQREQSRRSHRKRTLRK